MIFERLKQLLFPTNNKESEVTQTNSVDDAIIFDPSIDGYIKDIASVLDIELPQILKVALIFESNGLVQAQRDFIEKEVPKDASFSGGYYIAENNLVCISQKYPKVDLTAPKLNYVNLTGEEQLYHIAHELRHVWQKKYHNAEYYQKNAVAYECINDPAEVDADAFALAYVFSNKTPFTAANIPHISSEICLQAMADKGKRWSRSAKLSDDYSFGNKEKITEVKNSVASKELKPKVAILKLNGLI